MSDALFLPAYCASDKAARSEARRSRRPAGPDGNIPDPGQRPYGCYFCRIVERGSPGSRGDAPKESLAKSAAPPQTVKKCKGPRPGSRELRSRQS